MTARQIQHRANQLLREQNRYEHKYNKPIFDALISLRQPVADALNAGKPLDWVINNVTNLVNPGPLNNVLEGLYTYVGSQAAQSEQAHFKAIYGPEIEQKKAFGFSAIWNAVMKGVWEAIGAAKVTRMTMTEIMIIRRKLIASRQDPEVDLFRLAKQLLQRDVNWNRAKLISRTETGQAAGVGQNQAASRTGFLMRKEWITTIDGRERHFPKNASDHRKMNKVTVAMNEKFSVPSKDGYDLMDHAHDPAGPADQVCNCRCKTVYVAQRDARGRLIPTS